MKQLQGKVAAVTGAASGIGRALAINLANEGCSLALSDVNEKGLAETAEMVGDRVRVTTHVVDVADRKQVEAYASATAKEHGGVDIVINNAGVTVADTLEDVSYDDFEWVFNIDFWGVVYGTKAFLPLLKNRPKGYIVNISSINGMVPFPLNGPYNSAKFAVRGFNMTLIQELKNTNVQIMSVHPGGVKTGIVSNARFRKLPNEKLSQTDFANRFDAIAQTTADQAAKKIVSGMKKNKQRLFVGSDAKFMATMSRLLPLSTVKVTGFLHERFSGR